MYTEWIINRSKILYVDSNKKRTNNWLTQNRLQLPVGQTNYWYNNSISQNNNSVNTQYMQDGQDNAQKDFGDFAAAQERVNNGNMKNKFYLHEVIKIGDVSEKSNIKHLTRDTDTAVELKNEITKTSPFADSISQNNNPVNTQYMQNSQDNAQKDFGDFAAAQERVNSVSQREAETKENKGKTFSLKGINKEGVEIYETSDKTKNLSFKEKRKKFIEMMDNAYKGRTAKFYVNGKAYYAQFEKRDIQKNIYGDNKSDSKG